MADYSADIYLNITENCKPIRVLGYEPELESPNLVAKIVEISSIKRKKLMPSGISTVHAVGDLISPLSVDS